MQTCSVVTQVFWTSFPSTPWNTGPRWDGLGFTRVPLKMEPPDLQQSSVNMASLEQGLGQAPWSRQMTCKLYLHLVKLHSSLNWKLQKLDPAGDWHMGKQLQRWIQLCRLPWGHSSRFPSSWLPCLPFSADPGSGKALNSKALPSSFCRGGEFREGLQALAW